MNILITGATSGIGLETARTISNSNNNLFLVGRNFSEVETLINNGEISNHHLIQADLSKLDELANMVEKLPVLDAIVLAAGVTLVQPFKFTTEETILRLNNINYNSQVILLQKLLATKKIAKGASIVIISSISATVGMKANSIYAGTKGALIAFSKSLALELAPQKIRVNCLQPGVVKTRMVKESIDPAHLEEHAKLYPLGLGEPQDVASVIKFFVSPGSKWITGTSLVIDGGFSVQ